MNTIAYAQLTFQMLTSPQKYSCYNPSESLTVKGSMGLTAGKLKLLYIILENF